MRVLSAEPMRGGLPTAVPTDPTIYRFYEVLQVYGGAIKELIHEQLMVGVRRERHQLQRQRREEAAPCR